MKFKSRIHIYFLFLAPFLSCWAQVTKAHSDRMNCHQTSEFEGDNFQKIVIQVTKNQEVSINGKRIYFWIEVLTEILRNQVKVDSARIYVPTVIFQVHPEVSYWLVDGLKQFAAAYNGLKVFKYSNILESKKEYFISTINETTINSYNQNAIPKIKNPMSSITGTYQTPNIRINGSQSHNPSARKVFKERELIKHFYNRSAKKFKEVQGSMTLDSLLILPGPKIKYEDKLYGLVELDKECLSSKLKEVILVHFDPKITYRDYVAFLCFKSNLVLNQNAKNLNPIIFIEVPSNMGIDIRKKIEGN